MAVVDGATLKVLRERTGWSGQDFAAALGISAPYLSDIEAGRRTLKQNPALLKRMAEALNVPQSMIQLPIEDEEPV